MHREFSLWNWKYDVYEDFFEDKNLLGFSDYPRESKFFDHVNKKVIGKMQDKFKGNIINEFVGLNPKKYSIIGVDSREAKQAAGANKNGVKSIIHKEFLDALFNTKITWNKSR